MKEAGFNVTHVYGLTETYGPAVVNDWRRDWDALPAAEQAAKKARQGVRYLPLEALEVLDPQTLQPVERDGETLGEVMFRGNVVMKGYLKNKTATAGSLRGRLVSFRRSRRQISGQLHPAQRPIEGHHYFRRREYFLDRGRGGPLSAPGRAGDRRRRQARREMGRDAMRFRRAKTRRPGERRGTHRLVPKASRRLQMPALRGLQRAAEDVHGQDPKIQAARAGENGMSAGGRITALVKALPLLRPRKGSRGDRLRQGTCLSIRGMGI